MGGEGGGVGGMSGVWFGVRRGCVCGCIGGVSGVWLGSAWERLGCGCGCSWGSVWGADLVRMNAPGSFWGLDGTEVLCFRRCEEVRGCIDDRIRIFLALLDALGVTPVWK